MGSLDEKEKGGHHHEEEEEPTSLEQLQEPMALGTLALLAVYVANQVSKHDSEVLGSRNEELQKVLAAEQQAAMEAQLNQKIAEERAKWEEETTRRISEAVSKASYDWRQRMNKQEQEFNEKLAKAKSQQAVAA